MNVETQCTILTYHINWVDIGKLREELTTTKGELGIWLEELLSGDTKQQHKEKQRVMKAAKKKTIQ